MCFALLMMLLISSIQVVPDFSVLCRRLTPGDGYLEALCADNVSHLRMHLTKLNLTYYSHFRLGMKQHQSGV